MCDRNINLLLIFLPIIAQCNRKKVNVLGSYFQDKLILIACNVSKGFESNFQVQSNSVIRNFLVTQKLFLNPKCSLSICSKFAIGHWKWFLNTNLFLIKPFLITKFDFTWKTNLECWISNLNFESRHFEILNEMKHTDESWCLRKCEARHA